MSGLSCFGNFSMGELAQLPSLSFNLPGLLDGLEDGLIKENCAIPGFKPPTLPNFALPPIPLFPGIPAFPLFCLLPPFPGLPALSLPGISIPIPPIPFVPPIPLPIPGFALPFLPTLPSFDLGSFSFLCGLLNIDLPVIDPFAFLNDLINKLNALIAAFNDFLNFCKDNAEAINATEVPPELPPSVAAPAIGSSPTSPTASNQLGRSGGSSNQGGVNVPTPLRGEAQQQTQDAPQQEGAVVDLSQIVVDPTQPAGDLALLLADNGQIPAEAALVNKAANLLAPLGNMADVTQEQIQTLFDANDITSAEGFVGFKSDDFIPLAATIQEVLDNLTAAGRLSSNKNAQTAALEVLKNIDLAVVAPVEVAIALNKSGVPVGNPPTTLARITQDDIIRAHFLRNTTAPLTGRKIVNILVLTGIVEQIEGNVINAIDLLEELPSPLTPATLEAALDGITPGPARGSLKASCIASTKGIDTATRVEIDEARSQTLLQSAGGFSETTFVRVLSNITLVSFRRIFRGTNLQFPVSLFDLIPFLAIEFEVDDFVLSELFSLFNVTGNFDDLDSLFAALQFIAQSVSSQQSASLAIRNCLSTKEGDFSFDKTVAAINLTLQKFGITFPTDAAINVQIANALKLDQSFSFLKVEEALGETVLTDAEELTFLLLATGLVQEAASNRSDDDSSNALAALSGDLSLLAGTGLANPIVITIKSPTNVAEDIVVDSLNISLKTKKISSAGIVSVEHAIITDGVVSSGTTIVLDVDDLNGKIEITVYRIGGFIETLEAIEEIVVAAGFISTFNTTEQAIPQNLISTRS